jgi:hypothetical protein
MGPERIDAVLGGFHHQRALEPGHGGLRSLVALDHELAPFRRVDALAVGLGLPEVDATDGAAVLRDDVVLADEAGDLQVVRRGGLEDGLQLLLAERLRHGDLNDGGVHVVSCSMWPPE